MDRLDTHRIVEDAASCAAELRRIVESLPALTFGGDLSRDFIVEGCNRVENTQPRLSNIKFPDGFLPDSRLPRTVVGTLGDTGVGKSKLLSALLGKNVLPTSSSKRGTSFPTIIVHHPHPTIEAAVSFMSKEDFTKHVETAIDLVKPDEDGDYMVETSLKVDPSYSLLSEALGLFRDDFAEEGASVETILAKCPEVRKLLGTIDIVEADNDKKFLKETTRRYARRIGHFEYKKWPLVDLMVIKCNSELLSEGVILVDLPGSADVSATVLRATEAFKDKLHFTLGAARVERSEDDAGLLSYIQDEINRQRRMQSNGADQTDGNQADSPPSRQPPVVDSTLAAIVTKCDSNTNVKLDELERDNEIAPLLRENRRYLALRKHQRALESRIRRLEGDDDDDSDLDELASDGEASGPSPDNLQTRKRSQSPNESTDASAVKRRRTSLDSATDVKVKIEGSKAPRLEYDADRMVVDPEADVETLQRQLDACKKEREIIAAGVRSQVICRTIRKQYHDHATKSLAGDIASLPVFATSAEDFAQTLKKSGKLDLSAELERSGIPAARAFIHNLGAREQYAMAADVIQPFRAQVTSVLDLVSVVEPQSVGVAAQQKQMLMETWATQGSMESEKLVSGGIQFELKAALNVIVGSEIKEVRSKLALLEAACTAPLMMLAAERVPTIMKEIVKQKQHWGIWRAHLRHNGVYNGVDWNRKLAAPLLEAMGTQRDELYEQWNRLSGTALQNKVINAGIRVLQKIMFSSTSYEANLKMSVNDHVNKAMALVAQEAHKLQQIVIAEVLDNDERASRSNSVVEAVEAQLSHIYDRALKKIKGRESTVKQKDFVEEAVNEAAESVFKKVVQDFINERRATIDKVETKLLEALEHMAKEAELAISPVWASAGYDAEQIEARARAAEVVTSIRNRLLEMEEALKSAMERSAMAPSCYPPPTIF
ncbi:unnamed protein product [Peniophora sp. CBMAI 1063]|nr:unnamed protein product [Peniophora sp. CBMAI 1063]